MEQSDATNYAQVVRDVIAPYKQATAADHSQAGLAWADNQFVIGAPIPPHKYIFAEDQYLNEIHQYIKGTYSQHYIGGDPEGKSTQTTERIVQNGHGTGFCMGNITKYADRYGKKKGYVRKDLLKLIHYAVIQLYIHDKEGLKETS